MMRLSHPMQVVMKPLYACNFGCGSTGSGRCFVGIALRGRGKNWCQKWLVFSGL